MNGTVMNPDKVLELAVQRGDPSRGQFVVGPTFIPEALFQPYWVVRLPPY